MKKLKEDKLDYADIRKDLIYPVGKYYKPNDTFSNENIIYKIVSYNYYYKTYKVSAIIIKDGNINMYDSIIDGRDIYIDYVKVSKKDLNTFFINAYNILTSV